MIRKILFLTSYTVCLMLMSANFVVAQKGNYFQINGLYQYSSIANRNDLLYSDYPIKFNSSFYPGFGFSYINNSSNIFGIELGMGYAGKGQKYSGTIEYDANTKDTGTIAFTSEVRFNSLHFPFLFRFNSILDEDVVFLTISAGVQLDYLISARMTVSPAPLIPAGGEIDIKQLYNSANLSFVSNAIFNWQFSDLWLLNFGINMSRSLFNIEKLNFPFDKNLHAVEYYFPVSVKKEIRPALEDIVKRQPSKFINYAFVVGVSFLIKPI